MTHEFSVLRKIRLQSDKEKNIMGGAEIFAVVSGLGANGQAQVKVLDMPWLDHDKRDYAPNMDLVDWSEWGANYVNIQLFEDDDDTDFGKLAGTLVKGAQEGLAAFPAATPYTAIGKIGELVLNAMDPKWFRNDVDYVDSFYLIERGKSYAGRRGAANNATVTIEPHSIG